MVLLCLLYLQRFQHSRDLPLPPFCKFAQLRPQTLAAGSTPSLAKRLMHSPGTILAEVSHSALDNAVRDNDSKAARIQNWSTLQGTPHIMGMNDSYLYQGLSETLNGFITARGV